MLVYFFLTLEDDGGKFGDVITFYWFWLVLNVHVFRCLTLMPA